MPQPCYRSCYQVLRISPHCDFPSLRLAYRRRVMASHPDRYYVSDPARALRSEAELKRVVGAYRLLLLYLRRYGELPSGDLPIEQRGAAPSRPAPPRQPTPSEPAALWREIRGPWRRAAIWLLIAVLGVELVAMAWYLNRTAPASISHIGPGVSRTQRAPLPNSTTSTVRSKIARSNPRLWFLT